MTKVYLNWQLGCSAERDVHPAEFFPAVVPGAAQADYARAKGWPDMNYGVNCKAYKQLEDMWWLYTAPLDFTLAEGQIATMVFTAIDYAYEIRVGGQILHRGEGMFSPIRLDVTPFAGKRETLEVLIYPAPKCDDSDCRDQARKSAKACASYGWDWHPRLISAGLWDEAYLEMQDNHGIAALDASYRLRDDLSACDIDVTVALHGIGDVAVQLLDGDAVVAEAQAAAASGEQNFRLSVAEPKLWYPVGYGDQHRYTLRACTLRDGAAVEQVTRTIGFRRSRMVMNDGAWDEPSQFPKSRSDAPATLEINGRRIFAKGSNWVNARIFPGEMTADHYRTLLTQVRDANMNILRIWGGGPVNKECFFDICDELGIMVWQEFPLACNEYPDEDGYLSVLKQDATAIVKRLRTHPSLVLWCGGNELFNAWSGMTEQHHALRLLDTLCYEHDRFTPFIMTSPLNGMGHGHYLNYDETTGREFITDLVHSQNTAYTEFGAPGMADIDYLRKIMSEEDLNDCRAENEVWLTHHGFKAWFPETWVRKAEANYYFGGFDGMEDLCGKTRFIQAMGYRSLFEEMRKQWPHCSMALNWCFNEPWPTVANNSLLSWPDVPKPAYYAVQKALRPQIASLRVEKHLWWDGETFRAEVWMLNDAVEALPAGRVTVSCALGDGEYTRWGTLDFSTLSAQTNRCCGELILPLPVGFAGKIRVRLAVEGHGEMDSEYTYLCRARRAVSTKGMLNM